MTTQEKRKRGRQLGSGPEVLERMQKIIDYIDEHSKREHVPPTLAQIAIGVGRPETDVPNIQGLVQRLIAGGWLENKGRFASLVVTNKAKRKRFYEPNEL